MWYIFLVDVPHLVQSFPRSVNHSLIELNSKNPISIQLNKLRQKLVLKITLNPGCFSSPYCINWRVVTSLSHPAPWLIKGTIDVFDAPIGRWALSHPASWLIKGTIDVFDAPIGRWAISFPLDKGFSQSHFALLGFYTHGMRENSSVLIETSLLNDFLSDSLS